MVSRYGPLALILALLVSSCSPASKITDADDSSRHVILISIDGFAHSYLESFSPPTLRRLAAEGSSLQLAPTFPSKTFPSHYSIVTGLHAGTHGVVANRMYDVATDEWFSLSDREAVSDGKWYQDGEPIWVTARRQGLISATMFWPGSEAEIRGHRPNFWKPYDHQMPDGDRVQQVLDWLDLPSPQKPDFVSIYFSQVDGAGHRYGPTSVEVDQAIQAVDSTIATLLKGLEDRDLRDKTDIIVVSDHGMTEIDTSRVIFLDDYLNLDQVTIIDTTPVLALHPGDTPADTVLKRLQGAHDRMEVYAKEDVPARFHFSKHERIPAVVGIADEGWTITTRPWYRPERLGAATHGYDNELDSMQGILIASGPSFRSSNAIKRASVVDVYNLISALLEIDPALNEGSGILTRTLITP